MTIVDWAGRTRTTSFDDAGKLTLDVDFKPVYLQISISEASSFGPDVRVVHAPAEQVISAPLEPELAAHIARGRGLGAPIDPSGPPTDGQCFALFEWPRGLGCCLGSDVVLAAVSRAQVDEIIRRCGARDKTAELRTLLDQAFKALENLSGQESCAVSWVPRTDEEQKKQRELLGLDPPSSPGPACDDY